MHPPNCAPELSDQVMPACGVELASDSKRNEPIGRRSLARKSEGLKTTIGVVGEKATERGAREEKPAYRS